MQSSQIYKNQMKEMACGNNETRAKYTVPVSQATHDEILSIQPMGFFNHMVTLLFLTFGVPTGGMYVI